MSGSICPSCAALLRTNRCEKCGAAATAGPFRISSVLAQSPHGRTYRAEGPEGVEAVLQLLDGYELPAAAWEPEALALRVQGYLPQWLDQLCFTGRIGWGRYIEDGPRITRIGRINTNEDRRGEHWGESAAAAVFCLDSS